MTTEEAIKTLKHHNRWRRGANIEMDNPKKLGEAIDQAIRVMEKSIKKQNEMTKERYYRNRAAILQKRMEQIEAKHPEVNFTDTVLRDDFRKYIELMQEVVYARVNADECHSDDPNRMCEKCECWKSKK